MKKEVEKKDVEKKEVVNKKEVKQQLITFAIGVLVGAIITAGIFMIASPKQTKRMPDMGRFGNFTKFDENGTRPERPSGERPNGNRPSRRGSRSNSNETIEGNTNEN